MSENRNNNKYISWPVNELDVVNVPENTRIASSARTCSLARGGAGLDIELVCKVSTIVSFYQNLQCNKASAKFHNHGEGPYLS